MSDDHEERPVPVRGVERSLTVRLGGLGGFDLRPTRVFLWGGGEREATERVLPLGSAPRSLQIPRRPREVRAGSVEVRTVDGEIQVRGPMLLRCYRDGSDPKDGDGWLPTASDS